MDQLRQVIFSVIEKKESDLNFLEELIQNKMKQENFLLFLSNMLALTLIGLSLLYVYRSIEKLHKKDLQLSLALQNLQEIAAFQEALLSSANYAIIATQEKGIITTFNPAAEKMLGYRKEEVIGKLTLEAFHDSEEIETRTIDLSRELHRKITPGLDLFAIRAKEEKSNISEWTYIRYHLDI